MSIAAGWLLIGFITWAIWSTYMYGIGGIWVMVVPWAILLFGMVVLVSTKVRSIKAISQPQMLQNRFGLPLRVLVSPFSTYSARPGWPPKCGRPTSSRPSSAVQPVGDVPRFRASRSPSNVVGGIHSVLNSNVLQFFRMAIIYVTVVTSASSSSPSAICRAV